MSGKAILSVNISISHRITKLFVSIIVTTMATYNETELMQLFPPWNALKEQKVFDVIEMMHIKWK